MLANLLTNRTVILISAFVGGLVFSDVAGRLGTLTMPALAVVLTVSTTQLSARDFLPLRRVARPVFTALLLNFGVLGSLILLLAWWLMPTRELWIGYVLVAAAPPGVAIIPFTHILRGDLRLSLQGTFGLYLVCLLLTPALVYLFTGVATVSPLQLIRTMLMLVLIPFAVAQVYQRLTSRSLRRQTEGRDHQLGLFCVIFTVVGLNRDVFLRQPRILFAVSLPAVLSSFGLAFLVDLGQEAQHR